MNNTIDLKEEYIPSDDSIHNCDDECFLDAIKSSILEQTDVETETFERVYSYTYDDLIEMILDYVYKIDNGYFEPSSVEIYKPRANEKHLRVSFCKKTFLISLDGFNLRYENLNEINLFDDNSAFESPYSKAFLFAPFNAKNVVEMIMTDLLVDPYKLNCKSTEKLHTEELNYNSYRGHRIRFIDYELAKEEQAHCYILEYNNTPVRLYNPSLFSYIKSENLTRDDKGGYYISNLRKDRSIVYIPREGCRRNDTQIQPILDTETKSFSKLVIEFEEEKQLGHFYAFLTDKKGNIISKHMIKF